MKAGRASRPWNKLDWTCTVERGVRKDGRVSGFRPVQSCHSPGLLGASYLLPGLSAKPFSRTKTPSKPPIISRIHLVESMLKMTFLSLDIVDI